MIYETAKLKDTDHKITWRTQTASRFGVILKVEGEDMDEPFLFGMTMEDFKRVLKAGLRLDEALSNG